MEEPSSHKGVISWDRYPPGALFFFPMISFSRQIFNLSKQQSIVLLCSSGVDSVAAAHFFVTNFPDYLVSLLHFNHSLRAQNNQMAEVFETFAKSLTIPYKIKVLACKDSTEDSCRKARMEYMQTFVDTVFITAHHLDDCVESYLMNCIRGKEGFLPMPFHTQIGDSCSINRPFLMNKKKDFVEYVEANDLSRYVVEDDTNHQVRGSRRNLMRNRIIPVLDEHQVGIHTVVKKKMLARLKQ